MQRVLRGLLGPRPVPEVALDPPPVVPVARSKQGGHNGYLTFGIWAVAPGAAPAAGEEDPGADEGRGAVGTADNGDDEASEGGGAADGE